MSLLKALSGGIAGAAVLTAVHQLVKNGDYKIAPRMDLLGMESIVKLLRGLDVESPAGKDLYAITLAADVLSNAAYYSLAGIGKKNTMLKGLLLGLAAGAGAVYLPGVLGLKRSHSGRTCETKVLAIGYYVLGALIAAGVISVLDNNKQFKKKEV